MKYDTIIIGGGLSGLVAGVKLASQNRKVAIVTSGQSALHFSSGSASLLSRNEQGEVITNPLEEMAKLPDSHPYKKIGTDRIAPLAHEAMKLLNSVGVKMEGHVGHCRYRLTPMGMWEPTWMSLEELASCEHPSTCPWRKAAIVNFNGYLDFFPEYLADGLSRMGIKATCHVVTLPELARLRKSCSEMRAASIAKVLRGEVLEALGAELLRVAGDADVILLPAVVGLKSNNEVQQLTDLVNKPVRFVPVIPMSVVGVRSEFMFRHRFEQLGGTYLLGDSVKKGLFQNGHLHAIHTVNLGEETPLEADHFILATGSFFSQGLVAKPDTIEEPVFGLDVDQTAERTERYSKNFFDAQPYMRFGVHTDSEFRVSLNGETIDNLRAVGAILSGANPLKEGSGAGIAMLTALETANRILSLSNNPS
ncbi:MAG: glycerol-3-phosphate dehydrogenase subunit GlpB [Firmicutes bacterium]|nr:glycerol-3-phosphate dehydrogenase subunit GlpB [Bacillota bacterium]MCM1401486.1 glycerol-3-phosphate dehydrogenase subunit GlpB [Bacteroides sp.]MCM1477421.1 glycerol-3-phosphate dehydrogenase subunit GlpB [Bacteroides sp.]